VAATTPHRSPDLERLDFGYSWFWTYGQLLPTVGFAAAAGASTALGGPAWLSLCAAGLTLWALAGFAVMRFVVRMDELAALPSADFAAGGARVLDLGCGAGRTSVIVALERPQSRVVALDDFSADYIEGHGEAKTRSNFRLAGVEARVQIQHGDMRNLPFPDASFDGVVSSAAIDHLERADIPVALAEANRVLRSHGQVLLWLIVPSLWTFIAYGPLLYFHNATRRDWREMLDGAGFRIDSEGTTRGLAWMLATREREPCAANEGATAAARATRRHALGFKSALALGVVALGLLGHGAAGLWLAGAGVVIVHLGAAFFGQRALRRWLHRRRGSAT
jgi:ubiquinone/menaquinone biosynthesis C-methylase UbiE